MLGELLYADRALVDYPDKNLAILPVEDWPYFARYRRTARENGAQFEGLGALEAQALDYIRANGPVSAEELPIAGKIHWHSSIHWSGNWSGESNAARSVLEQLYSTGELIIHHKKARANSTTWRRTICPPPCSPRPIPCWKRTNTSNGACSGALARWGCFGTAPLTRG